MPESPSFDTVAILGMGLIGGSLGMALRVGRVARQVIGVARREATVRETLQAGAADRMTLDPVAAARAADLVVLAMPVLSVPAAAREVAHVLREGAIVTDVGSTKAWLERRLPEALPPGAVYVGGHPMAGSERAGIAAARADLFQGATYVLTRPPGCPEAAVARLAEMAERIGARPVVMDAAEHDRVVARVSHLPHVVAAALAAAVAARDPSLSTEQLQALAAGGFRDSTRIAASPPEMWRDVCLTNREPLLAALADLEVGLAAFRAAVEEEDGEALMDLFAQGAEARASVLPDTGRR